MKKLIASGFVGAVVALAAISLMGSRDGNGNYTLPGGNPVSDGQTLTANLWNTTFSDLATAMTNSLAKDGQTVPTANLPMGGFKHTSVANATSGNQYAAAGQVQDFSMQTLSSVSGTNTIVGSLIPSISSYTAGMVVSFTPANTNTGATTLSINGLAARPIVKRANSALISGDLSAGDPSFLIYAASGGGRFILLNPITDMSGAQVLAQLATVDGSGSGLDADMIDGVPLSGSQILTTANWLSNDGSGSGLDADLLDGLGQTSAATANTIATRDSSGYLFAGYFNQSSSNSENPSISQIVVTNGTDGYLRKASLAHAMASMSLSSIGGSVSNGQVPQSAVTQHLTGGIAIQASARNISGKTGTTKNLVPNASCPPAVSGEDGRITYCY